MRNSLSFFVFLTLSGLAHAGTVVLTGTCQHQLNASFVSFGLTNSGNDSAYNLHIIPNIQGARLANFSYVISSLGPRGSSTINVTLTNITAKGSYGDYFLVAYQQSSSSFTALFPCLLDFKMPVQSSIIISYNINYTKGGEVVGVNVLNAGNQSVNASISLILPPYTFTYLPGSYQNVSIGPLQQKGVKFTLQNKFGGETSFSGAVVADYIKSGVSYAAVNSLVITSKSPYAATALSNLLLIIPAVVIAIIILLLARVFLKKRKAGRLKQRNDT